MQTIKTLIIDDDVFIHEQLKDKLREFFPEINIVAVSENALQGIEAIKQFSPQLIFLDIQLPDLNGFEMLNHIEEKNFKIIFITSFNQYAIEAIRYSAFDYLLKPVKDDELKNSITRFRQSNNELTLKGKMENLLYNIGKSKEDFLLIIPTRQGEKKIPVHKIIRCEADSNYTHFYLSDKTKFTASKTLKEFEEILSENDFIRIHKSHIVNKLYIKSVSNDGYAELKDGLTLEISRRRLSVVKQNMN
ncbi:MAG TPA: LytTR family DNA-binding domain-containing protein [Bacteroidia bacterium]|nr:LytTR family DNA-binding domain-containing protein [Bacteroidia bacterium]